MQAHKGMCTHAHTYKKTILVYGGPFACNNSTNLHINTSFFIHAHTRHAKWLVASTLHRLTHMHILLIWCISSSIHAHTRCVRRKLLRHCIDVVMLMPCRPCIMALFLITAYNHTYIQRARNLHVILGTRQFEHPCRVRGYYALQRCCFGQTEFRAGI
jgi:hypothetical protein